LQERAILITRRDCGSFLMALPCMRECEIIYIYICLALLWSELLGTQIKKLISIFALGRFCDLLYYIMTGGHEPFLELDPDDEAEIIARYQEGQFPVFGYSARRGRDCSGLLDGCLWVCFAGGWGF
jgi:hypothetical protein